MENCCGNEHRTRSLLEWFSLQHYSPYQSWCNHYLQMHDGNLYNSVKTNTSETPELNFVGWQHAQRGTTIQDDFRRTGRRCNSDSRITAIAYIFCCRPNYSVTNSNNWRIREEKSLRLLHTRTFRDNGISNQTHTQITQNILFITI
jgi:hypothetical protein